MKNTVANAIAALQNIVAKNPEVAEQPLYADLFGTLKPWEPYITDEDDGPLRPGPRRGDIYLGLRLCFGRDGGVALIVGNFEGDR